MAFKLNKAEQTELQKLKDKLTDGFVQLTDAVDEYNSKVDQLYEELIGKEVAEYNAILEDTREFLADIYSRLEDEYAQKTEKWQESERGESIWRWIESIESVKNEMEDVEIDLPDSIDTSSITEHSMTFDDLSYEPE